MKKRKSNHIVKAASSVLLAGVVTTSTPGVLGAVEAAVDTVDSVDTLSGSTLKIDIKDVEYAGNATDRLAYDAFEVSFDNNQVFQDGINLLSKCFEQEKIEIKVNGETYEMDEFGQNIDLKSSKKEVKVVEKVAELPEELPAGIDTLAGATGGGVSPGGGIALIPELGGGHYEVNANFFTIGDNYDTVLLSKAAFKPGENEIEIKMHDKVLKFTKNIEMAEEPTVEVKSIPGNGIVDNLDERVEAEIEITGTATPNSKVNLALFVEGFEYLELAPVDVDSEGNYKLVLENAKALYHPEYYTVHLKNGKTDVTNIINFTAVIAVEDGNIPSNQVVGTYKVDVSKLKEQVDRAEGLKGRMTEEQEKLRMTCFKMLTDMDFTKGGNQSYTDKYTKKLELMLDSIENANVATEQLEKALANESKVKASAEYKKASKEEKKAYTDAIAAAKSIDPSATQEKIDSATRAILNAEYAIMEEAPIAIKETAEYNAGTSNFVIKFDKLVKDANLEELVFANIDEDRAEAYVNGVKYTKEELNDKDQKNVFTFGEKNDIDMELDEAAFKNGDNNVEIVLGNMRLQQNVVVKRTNAPTINAVSIPRTAEENEKIVITGKAEPNSIVNMEFYGAPTGDVITLRPITVDAEGNYRVEFIGEEQGGTNSDIYVIEGLNTNGEETVLRTNVLNLYEVNARAIKEGHVVSNCTTEILYTDVSELAKTVEEFKAFLEANEDFKLTQKQVALYTAAKANVARHLYETALYQRDIDNQNAKLQKIMKDSGLEIPTPEPEPEKPEVQSDLTIKNVEKRKYNEDTYYLISFNEGIDLAEKYNEGRNLKVFVNGDEYKWSFDLNSTKKQFGMFNWDGKENNLEIGTGSIKRGENTIVVKGENVETEYKLNVKATAKPVFTVESIAGTDTEAPKVEINVKTTPDAEVDVNLNEYERIKLNEVGPGEYKAVLTGNKFDAKYSYERLRAICYLYSNTPFNITVMDKDAELPYNGTVLLKLNTDKAKEAVAAVPEAAMSNRAVQKAVADLKTEISDTETSNVQSQSFVDKRINNMVEALNNALEGALGDVKDAKIAEIEALEISEEAKAGMTPESIEKAETKLEELKAAAIDKVKAAITVAAVTEVPAVNVEEAETLLVKAVENYEITGVEFSDEYGAHFLVTLNKSILDENEEPKVTEVTVNGKSTKFTVEDKDGNNKQLEIDATAFQNGKNTIELVIGNERVEYEATVEKTALEAEVVSVPSTDSERPKIKVTVKSEEGAKVTCEIADLEVILTETTPGVFTGEINDKAEGYYAPGEYANADGETSHIASGAGIKITAKAEGKIISESNTRLELDTTAFDAAVKAAEGIEDEELQRLIEGVTASIAANTAYQITLDEITAKINEVLETVTPEPEKPDNNNKPSRPSRGGGGSTIATATGSRIAGDSRVATAVAVSKDMYKNGTSTVIIANMNKFSDVLTAAPLASQKKAPILFVNADSIPQETMDEIKRLGAKNIFINGGEASVSKNVEKQLDGMKIERFAGADRYETAAKIAEKIRENGSKSIVEVANGEIFADALSMSSLAVKENAPIVLVKKNALPAASQKALLSWKDDVKKVNIAGSTGSVSDVAEKAIAENTNIKVARFGGADRYETSAKIAKAARSTATKAVYTSGEKFADALVAGPFAAKNNAPILLVQKNNVPASIEKYTKDAGVSKIFVIGGESTITKTVLDKLVDAAK